ncbi:PREDICTED: uncharacterized protein LOC105365964 [Ceratosolen solmsi marchali]|uniref:Uncharacterized protein LOC105365964 n=1 Tax=Ceratosolen solmsi marchali TaxID=326594 RepID=A0AAJ6YQY2_9HYME|nr:PREDICTED: uncharacterized protein LOC105365964 [Ceratosolen solmsi marchali]
MFGEIHYWLILGPELEYLLRLVDDRTFGLSTEFVIAVISDGKDYQLYDVYNIQKDRGTTLNITLLGKWNEISGLNISLKQTKFVRRSNMHRFILRAMFFKCTYKPSHIPLDDYLSDYANATKDARFKFGFQILRSFADLYNFSLKALESSAWEQGDTLGPIARALERNACDITGTPLNVNAERTRIIKFVHEDWRFRTFFIFRNPQFNEVKAEVIFRSFDNEVWYFILLLIVIGIVIYAIILQFETEDNTISSYSNSSLTIIGALCQQGTYMQMMHLSTRIVFFFIMMFSLLISNYYSACIVSTRLAQPIYKINDSLNELTKLHLKMSSEWMVYIQFFFNIQNWEIQQFYHNYWLKLPESLRYMEPETGIRLVQKGGFAYHTHPDISYPYIEKLLDNREICELNEVHLGWPTNTAFGVTYNSSFQELSRIGLTKIAEIGIRHRETVRWQFRKPYCRKDLLSASSITIYEFAPYLIILLMGMLLAIIAFMIELFIANRN